MTTTTNPFSSLYQLRALMPERRLSRSEAYRLAELQAHKLLQLHGIDDAGTPDDLVTGLPFVEIRLRSDLPEGASGLARWIKPRWIVLLNRSEPAVRRRFSLWHEFKHILDHDKAEVLYAGLSHDDIERISDYFAASVLMPRRIVKRLFGQGHHDSQDLAPMFGVSEVAMKRRLRDLGLTSVGRYGRCNEAARQQLATSSFSLFA